MASDHLRNQQSRKRDSIAHLLDQITSRPQSRRSNVGPAEIIHDDADDEVHGKNGRLADEHRSRVVLWVFHLCCDREESWGSGEGEDDGGDGGHRLGEVGVGNDLVVWNEWAFLGSGCRAVCKANRYGHDEDCGRKSVGAVIAK